MPSTSGDAQNKVVCSASEEVDRNVPSTSGKDSGKKTMVQTNLSVGKDGVEVISSPEQPSGKKKGKKTR